MSFNCYLFWRLLLQSKGQVYIFWLWSPCRDWLQMGRIRAKKVFKNPNHFFEFCLLSLAKEVRNESWKAARAYSKVYLGNTYACRLRHWLRLENTPLNSTLVKNVGFSVALVQVYAIFWTRNWRSLLESIPFLFRRPLLLVIGYQTLNSISVAYRRWSCALRVSVAFRFFFAFNI